MRVLGHGHGRPLEFHVRVTFLSAWLTWRRIRAERICKHTVYIRGMACIVHPIYQRTADILVTRVALHRRARHIRGETSEEPDDEVEVTRNQIGACEARYLSKRCNRLSL